MYIDTLTIMFKIWYKSKKYIIIIRETFSKIIAYNIDLLSCLMRP